MKRCSILAGRSRGRRQARRSPRSAASPNAAIVSPVVGPASETIAAFRSLAERFERDIDAIERLLSLDLSAWRCDEQIARLLYALASSDLPDRAGRRDRSAPRGSAVVEREG